jgi:hypothetical protein
VTVRKKLSQKTSRNIEMKVLANRRAVKIKASGSISGRYRPINAY